MHLKEHEWLQPALIERYLASFKPNSHNQANLRRAIHRFVQWVEHQPSLEQRRTFQETIYYAFTKYMEYKNFQHPLSFRMEMRRIQRYFTWLFHNGISTEDIRFRNKLVLSEQAMNNVQYLELKKLGHHMSDKDFIKVRKWCFDKGRERDYICFVLFWMYGLRGTELCNIQRKHFVRVRMRNAQGEDYFAWVMVRWGKVERSTGLPKFHELPPRVMAKIAAYFKKRGQWENENAFLFTKFLGGKTCFALSEQPYKDPKYFGEYFARITLRALGRRFNMHDVRRSRGTTLRKRGVPAEDVCKLLNMSTNTLANSYDRRVLQISQIDPQLMKVLF